tara:strand:- start:1403 stop:1600 length:198 start_codon:yes stop_codon:yes gene_type:complete
VVAPSLSIKEAITIKQIHDEKELVESLTCDELSALKKRSERKKAYKNLKNLVEDELQEKMCEVLE